MCGGVENAAGVRAPPLRIPVLDMRLPNAALRGEAVKAFSGTLTPMVALAHYGFEGAHADLVRRVAARYPEAHDGEGLEEAAAREYAGNGCYALHDGAFIPPKHQTPPPPSPDVDAVAHGDDLVLAYVAKMRGLAERLAQVCFFPAADGGARDGDVAKAALAARGEYVDGRVSLRCYPAARRCGEEDDVDVPPMPRLGAHLDGNLFTLLWASTPGLQVLDHAAAAAHGVSPTDVLSVGIPSIDADAAPKDLSPFMVDVVPDTPAPIHDYLLMTVGRGWLRSPLAHKFHPGAVECAVLHQVGTATTVAGSESRMSIPYLVDIHSA